MLSTVNVTLLPGQTTVFGFCVITGFIANNETTVLVADFVQPLPSVTVTV